MGRPRVDVGVVSCPVHPDGWVVRNGRYGPRGRQRQRWRCTPPQGAPHNFTGSVVRTVLEEPGFCESCEQDLAAHQGPGAVSLYRYPLSEVGLALERVGQGMTYSDAARRARVTTTRGRPASPQMVGNWVEVFAPIATAVDAETSWPETVILDDLTKNANVPGGGKAPAFTIQAVWGHEAGERKGRLWAVQAVPRSASIHSWSRFLASLPGQPRLVVSDHSSVILGAVAKTWPDSTLRLCRWHLKKNLSRDLRNRGKASGDKRADREVVDALDTPAGWEWLKAVLRDTGDPVLAKFVSNREAVLDAEFAAGELPDHWGNSAVETALRTIDQRIGKRAFCFRNATRTNLWLQLVRNNINGTDDATRYAAIIREHLRTHGRTSLPKQLTAKDRPGLPSLR